VDFPAAAAASAAAAQEEAGDMKTNQFLEQLHDDQIVAAIHAAEKKTSGEIRVYISHRKIDDALAAAAAQFQKLGMTKTKYRNAVLIFVAPRSHQFAIVGDEAVHRHCGDAFWQSVAAETSGHFKNSEFTQGIIQAVRKAGELLAAHFPPQADSGNELPDKVEHD
jgi:uncharacterized membrane protein